MQDKLIFKLYYSICLYFTSKLYPPHKKKKKNMMAKRTMQYLALTMTWIMHVLAVVQAKYLEPPLNTFSNLPSYVFPTLKYHHLYRKALWYCKGYCLHRCEFHFERYPAIYEECLDKCLLPCVYHSIEIWPHYYTFRKYVNFL